MSITKTKKIIIALAALLLLAGVVGPVAARYVSNYRKEAQIHASNFHFSADYLSYVAEGDTAPKYSVSSWGREEIQFCLYNYELENIAQVSETDIFYKLTLSESENWEITVYDQQNQPVQPEKGLYKLSRGVSPTYHRVCLKYTGTAVPAVVEVSAVAKKPYSMTLAAEFTLD